MSIKSQMNPINSAKLNIESGIKYYKNHFSLLTRSCQYDTFSSMSKKKKTKREKIIADLRRQLTLQQDALRPYQEPSQKSNDHIPKVIPAQPVSPSIFQKDTGRKEYGYVLEDVRKTLRVIALIFLANVAVFYLFEKHILSITFLGF